MVPLTPNATYVLAKTIGELVMGLMAAADERGNRHRDVPSKLSKASSSPPAVMLSVDAIMRASPRRLRGAGITALKVIGCGSVHAGAGAHGVSENARTVPPLVAAMT